MDDHAADLDSRLRAALRNAPDADAMPPPALSDAILRRARESVARPRRRLRWPRFAPMPWAGSFAALLVATLVGVLWWDQPLPPREPQADFAASRAQREAGRQAGDADQRAASVAAPPVAAPEVTPPLAAVPEVAPPAEPPQSKAKEAKQWRSDAQQRSESRVEPPQPPESRAEPLQRSESRAEPPQRPKSHAEAPQRLESRSPERANVRTPAAPSGGKDSEPVASPRETESAPAAPGRHGAAAAREKDDAKAARVPAPQARRREGAAAPPPTAKSGDEAVGQASPTPRAGVLAQAPATPRAGGGRDATTAPPPAAAAPRVGSLSAGTAAAPVAPGATEPRGDTSAATGESSRAARQSAEEQLADKLENKVEKNAPNEARGDTASLLRERRAAAPPRSDLAAKSSVAAAPALPADAGEPARAWLARVLAEAGSNWQPHAGEIPAGRARQWPEQGAAKIAVVLTARGVYWRDEAGRAWFAPLTAEQVERVGPP